MAEGVPMADAMATLEQPEGDDSGEGERTPQAGGPALVGPVGDTVEATGPDGQPATLRYRLIEAGHLSVTGGSETQITRLRAGLQPSQMGMAEDFDSGAPVVSPDGAVEAGRARAVAVRRAYKAGSADGYRAWLTKTAGDFGFEAGDVKGMRQPLLVREHRATAPPAEGGAP